MAGEPEDHVEARTAGSISSMSPAAFAIFFNDVFSLATDPDREHLTPLDAMRKHGITVDLPPEIARTLMPVLQMSKREIVRGGGPVVGGTLGNACGSCGACSLCTLCGELNAAAVGAASAALWNIF
jgi:hypothetical protein